MGIIHCDKCGQDVAISLYCSEKKAKSYTFGTSLCLDCIENGKIKDFHCNTCKKRKDIEDDYDCEVFMYLTSMKESKKKTRSVYYLRFLLMKAQKQLAKANSSIDFNRPRRNVSMVLYGIPYCEACEKASAYKEYIKELTKLLEITEGK